MSARLRRGVLVVAASLAIAGGAVSAKGSSPRCTTRQDGSSYGVDCQVAGSAAATVAQVGAPCRWSKAGIGEFFAVGEQPVAPRTEELFAQADGSAGRRLADGSTATGWHVACAGRSEFRWVRDDVSVEDVIGAAASSARGRIPTPALEINPPDRGIVNLGLWLAVEEVVVPVARAEAGWALGAGGAAVGDDDVGSR